MMLSLCEHFTYFSVCESDLLLSGMSIKTAYFSMCGSEWRFDWAAMSTVVEGEKVFTLHCLVSMQRLRFSSRNCLGEGRCCSVHSWWTCWDALHVVVWGRSSLRCSNLIWGVDIFCLRFFKGVWRCSVHGWCQDWEALSAVLQESFDMAIFAVVEKVPDEGLVQGAGSRKGCRWKDDQEGLQEEGSDHASGQSEYWQNDRNCLRIHTRADRWHPDKVSIDRLTGTACESKSKQSEGEKWQGTIIFGQLKNFHVAEGASVNSTSRTFYPCPADLLLCRCVPRISVSRKRRPTVQMLSSTRLQQHTRYDFWFKWQKITCLGTCSIDPFIQRDASTKEIS